MGERFLLDSNTVVYYLDDKLPGDSASNLDRIIRAESNLSVINQIELLGWTAPNPISTRLTEIFVNNSVVYPLSRQVVAKAIELRKIYKIKLPDTIIAATAIVHNFTLISRNDDDFRKIIGLKYWNPFTDPIPLS